MSRTELIEPKAKEVLASLQAWAINVLKLEPNEQLSVTISVEKFQPTEERVTARPHIVRGQNREVTSEDREVVRRRLLRVMDQLEYERIRDEICRERGLSKNQVGALRMSVQHEEHRRRPSKI